MSSPAIGEKLHLEANSLEALDLSADREGVQKTQVDNVISAAIGALKRYFPPF